MLKLEEVHRFGSNSTLLDLSIMARNGEDIPFKKFDEKVIKSMANIEGTKTAQVNTINVYDILNCKSLVVVKAAAEKIQEVYA